MTEEKIVRGIRHNDLYAEVVVEMHYHEGKVWSPTLSLADVRQLERVRKALESGDIKAVLQDAKVFRMTPFEASA